MSATQDSSALRPAGGFYQTGHTSETLIQNVPFEITQKRITFIPKHIETVAVGGERPITGAWREKLADEL